MPADTSKHSCVHTSPSPIMNFPMPCIESGFCGLWSGSIHLWREEMKLVSTGTGVEKGERKLEVTPVGPSCCGAWTGGGQGTKGRSRVRGKRERKRMSGGVCLWYQCQMFLCQLDFLFQQCWTMVPEPCYCPFQQLIAPPLPKYLGENKENTL